MADQILKTKIALKIKTLKDWTDNYSDYQPLRGEVCLCEIPGTQTSPLAAPAPLVLFKVGDGTRTFAQLDWVSAKAADVYSWAKKTEDEFKAWVKTLVTVDDIDLENYYNKTQIDGFLASNSQADQAYADGVAATAKSEAIAAAAEDATGKANTAESNAKAHAEAKVNELANGAVASNTTAIGNEESRAKGEEARIEKALTDYVASNDEALAEVRDIADAARTESEVNSQIDTKITALNLGTTYEPIGAETRAKAYVDGKFTDANLAQYTTEQEVKDIVDGVIASAADSDTYNSLTKLVDYIDAHGGEATDMAEAIDALEKDVEGLKIAPSAGIKATDIEAWNGEIGAKALAATKLDESVFTSYKNAHDGDYTNDAIDQAISDAIAEEAERADGKYEEKGVAAGLNAALKSELQAEIDADVEALADGQVNTNKLAIEAINNGETGIYARATAYADGLAGNYATAAQGGKADTALQSIEVGTGLKVSAKADNKQVVSIDEEVVFILDCNY